MRCRSMRSISQAKARMVRLSSISEDMAVSLFRSSLWYPSRTARAAADRSTTEMALGVAGDWIFAQSVASVMSSRI